MGSHAPASGVTHGHPGAHSRASIAGWIVLASLMAGVGLFFVFYWLMLFDWTYFLIGVPLVIVSLILFFLTWTGPESAD